MRTEKEYFSSALGMLAALLIGAAVLGFGTACQGFGDKQALASSSEGDIQVSPTEGDEGPSASAPLPVDDIHYNDVGSEAAADSDSDGVSNIDENRGVMVVPPTSWNPDAALSPRMIHMTWRQDSSTSITLQWQTGAQTLGSYVPKIWLAPTSHVQGDTMPYKAEQTAVGMGQLYNTGVEGNRVEWVVDIVGLWPDTEYTARVGTFEGFDAAGATFIGAHLSDPITFRTAPASGTAPAFRFIAAGDSRGAATKIQQNLPTVLELAPDFWLFNGDMTDLGTQTEWNGWFAAMNPALVQAPFMPVQGNHELIASNYYGQFALPSADALPAGMKEHAWSFHYANAFFIGLDSNTDAGVAQQNAWLESELAKASNDANVDWIIVQYHHPAYSASPKHGSTVRVQNNWVPLFEKYGVDLVFSGHDHDYERSKPIRGGQAVEAGKGVVYVVAGGFYADGYSAGNQWFTEVSVDGKKSNFAVIDVDGDSINVTTYAGNARDILDQFTLSK